MTPTRPRLVGSAPRRRPVQNERAEHLVVAKWLDLHGVLWFHPMSGGSRHPIEAARMKQMGGARAKGIPDFVIIDPPPRGEHVAAAIELKAQGGRSTPEQRAWVADLQARGWAAGIVIGATDAIRWLTHHGYHLRQAAARVEHRVDHAAYDAGPPWTR